MVVVPVPARVASHFQRVLDELPGFSWISPYSVESEQTIEQTIADVGSRLAGGSVLGNLEATLGDVLPGAMYSGEPELPAHKTPESDREFAVGLWFLGELAVGRCHQIRWEYSRWPNPRRDTWPVPRWVISTIESHFAGNGGYDDMVRALLFLRQAWPREASDSGESWDDWIGDRVDELIAHAALLEARWEHAWSYRHIGLLWGDRRLSVDVILLIRALCADTSLSADDVHQITLSDNGLTDFGMSHIDEVDRSLTAQLQRLHDEYGTNFVAASAARYLGRALDDNDFEEMADEIDYAVDPAGLTRSWTHMTLSISHLRFYSTSQIPDATRYATRHLSTIYELDYVADQALPTGSNPDFLTFFRERDELRLVTHPVPVPPIEIVIGPSSVGVAAGLCYNFVPTPEWFEDYIRRRAATLLRRAENEVRAAHGVPEIGAGWVGESELFDLVKSAFPNEVVLRHARPDWLAPQHLDVYLPRIELALEYQGLQHHEPVEFFGGEAAFRRQQQRDRKKRDVCKKAGCQLVEVLPGYDPDDVIGQIRARAVAIGVQP
jgi:hypothetical protein